MKAYLFKQEFIQPGRVKAIDSLYIPKKNIIFQEIKGDTGDDGEETKYKIRTDNQSIKRFKSLICQTSFYIGKVEYIGELNLKQRELNNLKNLVKIYEERERLQKQVLDLEIKEYNLELILANIEAKATI